MRDGGHHRDFLRWEKAAVGTAREPRAARVKFGFTNQLSPSGPPLQSQILRNYLLEKSEGVIPHRISPTSDTVRHYAPGNHRNADTCLATSTPARDEMTKLDIAEENSSRWTWCDLEEACGSMPPEMSAVGATPLGSSQKCFEAEVGDLWFGPPSLPGLACG
jgi:hypothetical protein